MRIRLRLVAVLGVVALAAGGLAALLLTGHATATATSSATTATVKRGTVAQTVSAAGTVQAASTRGLSFGTGGTVTVLSVKAGDAVTAGQVLAKIDDSDALDSVDSAQTAVDSAGTALARAKASASATPSASAAPGGNRAGSGGSGASGGGSGASGGGSGGSGGTTDSLMSAQQQLNNAELALSQAKQALAGTVITAPAAGRVLTVNGGVGDTETPGSTPFLSLGAASDTVVSASFTESDVAQLAVGQAATVTLPDKGTQSYTGKVSQVDPVGTASDKLVRYSVLIAFDQPPADLLYGQSANVAVTTASASGVLYLPSTAVTGVDNGTGTVTIRTGGADESRTVHIGLRGDRYTEIRSGLDEGQTVVVSG